MSETQTPETQSDTSPSELDLLKQRADLMGVKYSPKIGVDKLKEKIEAAMNGNAAPDEDNPETASDAAAAVKTKAQIRKELRDREMKLVRLRITNLNPSKADLPGEIFCVRNKHLGIVKKFIPYGEVTEDGYHVPHILYKQLKARKFLQVKTRQKPGSQEIIIEQNWVPEFALEVLEPLTAEELEKLATAQKAAGVV